MKITIYTISECKFSKQEKEYLKSHNLEYEEKNLELNKEWLNEMLIVSNNFAGTPVTKIEKDDGTIKVFKGFTKEEFDEFFGFNQSSQISQNISPPEQPTQLNQDVQQNSPAISNQNNQTYYEPSINNNLQLNQLNQSEKNPNLQIDSILDKLEEKTQFIDNPDNDQNQQIINQQQNNSNQNNKDISQNIQPSESYSGDINSQSQKQQENLNQTDNNQENSQNQLNQKPQNLPNIPDLPSDLKM